MSRRTIRAMLTAAALLAPAFASAQTQRPVDPNGPLVLQPISESWVISPDVKITPLKHTNQAIVGASIGKMMEDTFFIGAAGYGLVNGVDGMRMGYIGFQMGWVFSLGPRVGVQARGLFGFGAAGVGMCLGLIIFLLNAKRFPDAPPSGDDASAEERADESVSAAAASAVADSKPRNPVIAVILSLILPGMGHVYKGQVGAGLSWLLAYVLAWIWYFAYGGGTILSVVIAGLVIACAISVLRRSTATTQLSVGEWKRVGAIFVFFLFTILFWAAYEQKGASLNLFAKDLVRTEVFGMRFPSSWLQSCTPLFVIILAPIFSMLWVRWGKRQPSSPVKFTFGLLFIGLAYCLLVPAAWMTANGRISPLWLVGLYFLEVVGEMCLSPVGLSTVTKLAPVKLVGIMMGVWFLAASFGSKLAGYLSGFYVPQSGTLVKLYGGIAVGLLISAGILALLTPRIKKLMGAVR